MNLTAPNNIEDDLIENVPFYIIGSILECEEYSRKPRKEHILAGMEADSSTLTAGSSK